MNPEYDSEPPFRAWARSPLLERLAATIQPALKAWLESDDPARRSIKDLLHGKVLGHPLHPPLTDIPIGAWSVAAACDALELTGAEGFRATADVAIAIGALGATAAAAAGLADWSDTTDDPQRLGMLHALVNSAALASYIGSLLARRAGARGLGIATAFAGFALVSLGGYLGGELSFGMQLGVKHTAVPVNPPEQFTPVLDAAAAADGAMVAAQLEAIPLLVTRTDGAVHAVSGVCTHRGAPLAEGTQEANCVRCPWHGSRFSLAGGRVVEGPATFALTPFATRVAGGKIEVRA